MGDTIRSLEDKINASKVTHDVYIEEIKKIQKELKERGIKIETIETQMDDILSEIEQLGKREKRLLRKIKKTIESVEKRFR